ncbi:MAG: phage major capsid protein, P2 family [Thioalkalivibrio sp.]
MNKESRQKLSALYTRLARINGVSSVEERFTVDPSIQQRLENKVQESSAFLGQINMVGVQELKAQRVGITTRPMARRTDTNAGNREPDAVAQTDGLTYDCHLTEFDVCLGFEQIEAWAKFPDFQLKYAQAVVQQQARDRIMIGFHGRAAAAQTDRDANPNLEDVNIGWLQQWRDHSPERVVTEGRDGPIQVGGWAGADYKNLDALVHEARYYLLDTWHQEDLGLRVILPREMVTDKFFPMFQDHGSTPTELLAIGQLLENVQLGGLPVVTMPFMPRGCILITSPSNLSLYWQLSGRRRHIVENPKRNRIEDYNSSNDAYAVEDFGAGALIENVLTTEPVEPVE